MAGLGRGLGALLVASNRTRTRTVVSSDSENIDLIDTENLVESNEIIQSGQTAALNNLLSSRQAEITKDSSKSLKKRHRSSRIKEQEAVQEVDSESAIDLDRAKSSVNQDVSDLESVKAMSELSKQFVANEEHKATDSTLEDKDKLEASSQESSNQPKPQLTATSDKAENTDKKSTQSQVNVEQAKINHAETTAKSNSLQHHAKDKTKAVSSPVNKSRVTDDNKLCTVVVESGDVVTPPLKIAEKSLVRNILVQNLKPSVYQPRVDFSETALQELAESIKEHGLLEPLLVTRSKEDQTYEIICGERRFRAAKIAGLRAVPCLIRDLSEENAYAIALIENIQREELSPLELARAYEQVMQKFKYTQETLAKSLGIARSTLTNTLRLLKLENPVKQALRAGQIDVGHAKILLMLSGKHQIQACETIIEQNLTVSASDVMIKELVAKLKSREVAGDDKDDASLKAQPRFNNYEKILNKSLKGVKAKFVVKNENQGKLTLKYTSASELEYLLKVLGIQEEAAQ